MAQPEALAFDMYGTLVDPIAISEQLEGYLAAAGGISRRGSTARSAGVAPKAARVHVPPHSILALTKPSSVSLAFEGAWSGGPDS
jgi:hypothetical protein